MLRSEFVTQVELPLYLYKLHYNQTVNTVKALINAEKYNVSVAYAVNIFVEYRIKVLIWAYGIKETSLTMTKNSKVPELALSTVVFDVFNNILERIDLYHERTVTTFEKAVERMFEVRKMDLAQRGRKTKQVLRKLTKNLKQYETMVRKTQGILRSTLSFL